MIKKTGGLYVESQANLQNFLTMVRLVARQQFICQALGIATVARN